MKDHHDINTLREDIRFLLYFFYIHFTLHNDWRLDLLKKVAISLVPLCNTCLWLETDWNCEEGQQVRVHFIEFMWIWIWIYFIKFIWIKITTGIKDYSTLSIQNVIRLTVQAQIQKADVSSACTLLVWKFCTGILKCTNICLGKEVFIMLIHFSLLS